MPRLLVLGIIDEPIISENENIIDSVTSNEEAGQEKIEPEELQRTRATENQAKESSDEYFTNSKLDRDNMYSQIIESYQKMIDSSNITAEQKAIAQNEITKINNLKNAIMIAENIIKTKGFKNVVILVNGDSINAVVESKEITQTEVAQIQNIISRELSAEIENIHIANK